MTVEKVVEKKEPTDLQDIKQKIGSLATIMKSAMVGGVNLKEGEGVSSPKKREVFQDSPKKTFQGSPRKGKGILKPGISLSSVIDVMDGVMGGKNTQLQKTLIGGS